MKSTTTKLQVWLLAAVFPGKVLPRLKMYQSLNTLWAFTPEKYSFMPKYNHHRLRIDAVGLRCDSASADTIKPWVSLHKTVLKTTAQNWGGKFGRTALESRQTVMTSWPALCIRRSQRWQFQYRAGQKTSQSGPALSPFLTGRMFVRWTYFGQFDELWFVS